MPVPGPRTQHGPVPGYNNPQHELPHRFNLWDARIPVAHMGKTPGLMYVTLRGCRLGAGQIRRFWRQAVGYIAAPPAYSWTASAPTPTEHVPPYPGLQITRALRYMTRSVYAREGEDNTRFPGLHTKILPRVRSKPVTLGAGLVRSRPTVRNRMTSFGSRVPTINQPSPASEGQQAP
jgi:hypothetical protein